MEFYISILGICLYGFLGIVMLFTLVWNHCTKVDLTKMGSLATNVRRVFRFFIAIFICMRITWCTLHLKAGTDAATFVLNRLAVITFLTAFTLVVFYWAERFHKNYFESGKFLPQLGGIFVIVNALVYITQIVFIMLYFESDRSKEGNPMYEINILVDLIVSAVVSLGFFVYGWLLFFATKNTDDAEVDSRERELVKILIITVIFSTCFLCRVAMFAYRPLTGKTFPNEIFYLFGYFIPEVVPTAFQIYLSETVLEKQVRESQFIDDLYAESHDSIEDYKEHNLAGPSSPLLESSEDEDSGYRSMETYYN